MASFLVDENLPGSLARLLQGLGHAAVHVLDVDLQSRSDEVLVAYANAHGLAIITCDKGLANLRRFPPGSHRGIIVSRLPDELLVDEKARLIAKAIASLDPGDLDGSLIVVGKSTLRVRHKGGRK